MAFGDDSAARTRLQKGPYFSSLEMHHGLNAVGLRLFGSQDESLSSSLSRYIWDMEMGHVSIEK